MSVSDKRAGVAAFALLFALGSALAGPAAAATATDTTVADFNLGSGCAVVADTGDGEVVINVVEEETDFPGTALPTGWGSFIWSGGGGVTVAGSDVTSDGALARTDANFAPIGTEILSLELVGSISGQNFQHFGFGNVADAGANQTFNSAPWAMFSKNNASGVLQARVWNGGPFVNVNVGGSAACGGPCCANGTCFGETHTYRIDWSLTQVEFFIDGFSVYTEATQLISANMRPAISDFTTGGGATVVDSLSLTRVNGLACQFESGIFDGGPLATWNTLAETATVPAGTAISLETRTGDTSTPDGTWSAFAALGGAGAILSPGGQYLQYRASLTTNAATTNPSLERVDIDFTASGAISEGDATTVDFGAGSLGSCYLGEAGDGELLLSPTAGEEFYGPGFTTGWGSFDWCAIGLHGGSGCVTTIGGGVATIEGEAVRTDASYGPGRSLEFVATFGADPNQHAGFGDVDDAGADQTFNSAPWAIFSNGGVGGGLNVRTWAGGPFINNRACLGGLTPAGNPCPCTTDSCLGETRTFRIDWTSTQIDYYIDGTLILSETGQTIAANMRPAASDINTGDSLVVDWMRLTPYASPCTFESQSLDGGCGADWLSLGDTSVLPAGTAASFETRAADTLIDLASATYAPVVAGVVTTDGRYIQYRATLSSSDPDATPEIDAVDLFYLECTATGSGEAACNGVDDDCDCDIDEDYVPSTTNCGVGACAATGQLVCQNGSTVDTCSPGTPTANDATCDGVDDDCDGQVDEDYAPTPTSCGVGACADTGLLVCQAGGEVDTCAPGSPVAEICDGIDNDCDGAIDDGNPGSGQACSTGLDGVCAAGETNCLGGSLVCTQTAFPSAEQCNALDDDCDGATDEGDPGGGAACSTGLSGACDDGLTSCQGGQGIVCEQTVFPEAEICDGVDNDCDGLVDDGADADCNDADGCTMDFCGPGGVCDAMPFGPGAWGARANTLIPAHEHTLVEVGGLLYKIAGEETQQVEVFDPAGGDPAVGQWTNLGVPIPNVTSHHLQGVVDGADIYVPGGLFGFPGPASAALIKLDTTNLGAGWQSLAPMPPYGAAPNGTRGAMACAIQEQGPVGVATGNGPYIYCAGGLQNGQAVDHFQVYEIGSDTWHDLPAMPAGVRDHMEAVAVDGRIYVMGGRDTTVNATVASNEIYDPSTNSWSAGAALPTARGGHTLAVVDGKILVLGGEGGGPSSGTFPDVEAYNPGTDDWCTDLADLPVPVHASGTTLLGNLLHMAAGGPSQGNSSSTIHHVFSLEPGADNDNDGSPSPVDCDDSDPDRTPFAPELCDGIDNDCDGAVDEGNPEGGQVCSTGVPGVCATGTTACQAGGVVCVQDQQAAPDDTLCDGLDNDCDGSTDEDFLVTPTTCGVGACAATGQNQCVAGQEVDTCTAGTPAASDATCDAIDDDCDGSVDEDFQSTSTSCGVGQCASTGQTQCVSGSVQDTCLPGTALPEICDGLDNDCDGAVDDGNPGGGDSCGVSSVGECQLGAEQCTGGSIVCVGNVDPSPEVCDGLDNDCDGAADDGNPGGGGSCTTGQSACPTGVNVCQGGGLVCDPGGTTCDDGDACTQTDTCDSAAQCIGSNPVVCAGETDCTQAQTCNSSSGQCDVGAPKSAGTVCTSDGELCTDDECDGAGTCDHVFDETNDPSCVVTTTVTTVTSTSTTSTSTSSSSTTTLPNFPCGAVPATTCFEGGVVKVQVKDSLDNGKDQLKWTWSRGDATAQTDMGDPLLSTVYALCVYDHVGGVPSLAAALVVPPNGAWDSKAPKGWNYKDKQGVFAGVQKAKLKPGSAGRSKAQVKARGANIELPPPAASDRYFEVDPSLIVQLVTSDGACWNSAFASATQNRVDRFKAKQQ